MKKKKPRTFFLFQIRNQWNVWALDGLAGQQLHLLIMRWVSFLLFPDGRAASLKNKFRCLSRVSCAYDQGKPPFWCVYCSPSPCPSSSLYPTRWFLHKQTNKQTTVVYSHLDKRKTIAKNPGGEEEERRYTQKPINPSARKSFLPFLLLLAAGTHSTSRRNVGCWRTFLWAPGLWCFPIRPLSDRAADTIRGRWEEWRRKISLYAPWWDVQTAIYFDSGATASKNRKTHTHTHTHTRQSNTHWCALFL